MYWPDPVVERRISDNLPSKQEEQEFVQALVTESLLLPVFIKLLEIR